MMKKVKVTILRVVFVIAGVGWYLFRPELLFVDNTVKEGFPQVNAQQASANISMPPAVLEGMFHSNAHSTTGKAAIYELSDGKRVLRLTDFETSNGPDVQVYLVAAIDVNDNETVKKAGSVELGILKGNKGDQNYDIPAGIDLEKYRSVTIWCKRFSVNFGTAPLQ